MMRVNGCCLQTLSKRPSASLKEQLGTLRSGGSYKGASQDENWICPPRIDCHLLNKLCCRSAKLRPSNPFASTACPCPPPALNAWDARKGTGPVRECQSAHNLGWRSLRLVMGPHSAPRKGPQPPDPEEAWMPQRLSKWRGSIAPPSPNLPLGGGAECSRLYRPLPCPKCAPHRSALSSAGLCCQPL